MCIYLIYCTVRVPTLCVIYIFCFCTQPVAACAMPVMKGSRIKTNSEMTRKARYPTILDFCYNVHVCSNSYKSKYKKVGVFSQYGQYSLTFRALAPSSEKSCFSLTKGQHSKRYTILSVLAVHQPFYTSICISTLPTQRTTFYSNSQLTKQCVCHNCVLQLFNTFVRTKGSPLMSQNQAPLLFYSV